MSAEFFQIFSINWLSHGSMASVKRFETFFVLENYIYGAEQKICRRREDIVKGGRRFLGGESSSCLWLG